MFQVSSKSTANQLVCSRDCFVFYFFLLGILFLLCSHRVKAASFNMGLAFRNLQWFSTTAKGGSLLIASKSHVLMAFSINADLDMVQEANLQVHATSLCTHRILSVFFRTKWNCPNSNYPVCCHTSVSSPVLDTVPPTENTLEGQFVRLSPSRDL